VRTARSLAAILAGYAVMTAILRVFGPAPSALSMSYFLRSATVTIAGAFSGGFISAWLAGSHEIPHAACFGLLLVATSIALMLRQGAAQPGWYETTLAGCGPIAALFGAALRMLSKPPARTENQTNMNNKNN
jgi:hypothetical protein